MYQALLLLFVFLSSSLCFASPKTDKVLKRYFPQLAGVQDGILNCVGENMETFEITIVNGSAQSIWVTDGYTGPYFVSTSETRAELKSHSGMVSMQGPEYSVTIYPNALTFSNYHAARWVYEGAANTQYILIKFRGDQFTVQAENWEMDTVSDRGPNLRRATPGFNFDRNSCKF